jgi:sugar phosphate isomerase/epimerase
MTRMTQLKIGLSMLFCLGEGFPLMLKRLEDLNVHYVELVDDGLHLLDEKRVEALNHIAGSFNIEYTIHAPFSDINIAATDNKLRRFILKRLEKSLQYAHQLDCKLWVFHPGFHSAISSFYPGMAWHTNLQSVRRLLQLSREYKVKIGMENIPEMFPTLLGSVDDFSKFYENLGEDVGMVLDVGHANMNGRVRTFMDRFGEKIVHMHVSDNDGKRDLHLGVGKGTVDWQDFARAVRRIQFRGILMIESIEEAKQSLEALTQLLSQTA